MPDQPTPDEQRRDIAHALIRAGVSIVPGGSAINELLNLVVMPSIADRQRRWLEALDHDLSKIQERIESFSFDDLRQREDFTSSFLQATRVAATTHREEKLEALRNALLNIAVGDAPDDDTQAMFIALIEAYGPWHIRLLALFSDPEGCAKARGAAALFGGIMTGALATIVERVFPELRNRRDFYDRIVADLERGRLVSGAGLHVMMSAQGLRQNRTTDLGLQFLRFVSTPEALRT